MNLLYLFRQFGDPGLGQSGQVIAAWRFTDAETPVQFEGETYAPMGPVQGSPLTLSSERQSGSGTLTVLKDFPVAQLFLRGYPARPIWLQVINADTAQRSRSSRVRSVKWGEATATLNIEGAGSLLRREGLRIRFQGPCQWALYGRRCGVDRNLHLVTGTLAANPSADGLTLVSAAFATKPNGYFTRGDFECNGQSRMVTSHTGNTVTLLAPIDGLKAGDPFEASQGCDRSPGPDGCAKFNNTRAFGGHVNGVAVDDDNWPTVNAGSLVLTWKPRSRSANGDSAYLTGDSGWEPGVEVTAWIGVFEPGVGNAYASEQVTSTSQFTLMLAPSQPVQPGHRVIVEVSVKKNGLASTVRGTYTAA